MVNPFSYYSDSTRKILNSKLGEFSFFLSSWMKIFMHTWSCTLFDALTIFRSMSLSIMFALPFLSFVFPRFIRSLIPLQFYRTNSKIYAADFLLPLSYRCQITHVTRDVVLCCVCVCISLFQLHVCEICSINIAQLSNLQTIKSVYLHRSEDLHATTFVPYSLPITPSFLSD